MSLQNTPTQHSVSDALQDRHPYYPDDLKNRATFSSEIRKDEVFLAFRERCIPKLVALLEYENLGSEQRLKTFNYIIETTKTPEKKSEAIQLKCLEAISRFFQHDSSRIRACAARVCGTFFGLQSARQYVTSKTDCIPALVNLLQDSDVAVRDGASKSIFCFVDHHDGAQYVSNSPELVKIIMGAIPDVNYSEITNTNLFHVVDCLTKLPAGVDLCLEGNIARKLVDATKFEHLQRLISQVAWNISSLPQGKLPLIRNGLIPVLGTLLSHQDKSIRRISAGALLSISIEKQGKLEMGEESLCRSLCLALEDENGYIRDNALETIRSASDVPSIKDKYIRNLVIDPDLLEKVFLTGSANTLLKIVEETESPKLVICALDGIQRVVHVAPHDVFKCLYSIEIVAAKLADKNPLTARLAKDILISLCKINSSAKKRLEKTVSEILKEQPWLKDQLSSNLIDSIFHPELHTFHGTDDIEIEEKRHK